MSEGHVFGYEELLDYSFAPSAVTKAVSRMVSKKKIERLSNGKFYVPRKGVLGPLKPSDEELIRSVLYNRQDVKASIEAVKTIAAREKTPAVIPPDHGWSPHRAGSF